MFICSDQEGFNFYMNSSELMDKVIYLFALFFLLSCLTCLKLIKFDGNNIENLLNIIDKLYLYSAKYSKEPKVLN